MATIRDSVAASKPHVTPRASVPVLSAASTTAATCEGIRLAAREVSADITVAASPAADITAEALAAVDFMAEAEASTAVEAAVADSAARLAR
jgi:hypothetical protein